jgi:hypothetical protein
MPAGANLVFALVRKHERGEYKIRPYGAFPKATYLLPDFRHFLKPHNHFALYNNARSDIQSRTQAA